MTSLPSLEKSLVPGDGEDRREQEGEGHRKRTSKRYREIVSTLPKELGWTSDHMYQYQGFWYTSMNLEGVMWAQQHFKATHLDVFLASTPKSGTTWLKALMFAIMNRTRFDFSTHPLLTSNPHELVTLLEFYFHWNIPYPNPNTPLPKTQLFQTHIPFTSLPESIVDSQCRILYLCRNPKDVFVSMYCFKENLTDINLAPLSIEEAVEQFCKGVSLFGPFWDHVLGYWKVSLEWPERVLFLKYEDLKRDSLFHVKRLAEFLGCPFSLDEEKEGIVHEIIKLCSFENLSNLKVNKTGVLQARDFIIEKKKFFRKGEVGDWKNHLTTEMGNCLNRIMDQKLDGSGLTFHDSLET